MLTESLGALGCKEVAIDKCMTQGQAPEKMVQAWETLLIQRKLGEAFPICIFILNCSMGRQVVHDER